MRNNADDSMYRTFEEFEREELRRAEAINGTVDNLFDDMFSDELELGAASAERTGSGRTAEYDYSDDEEE